MSHPSRMRGLKPQNGGTLGQEQFVASFTDAWIETENRGNRPEVTGSHPSRMRGLKPVSITFVSGIT